MLTARITIGCVTLTLSRPNGRPGTVFIPHTKPRPPLVGLGMVFRVAPGLTAVPLTVVGFRLGKQSAIGAENAKGKQN
jgi:hypothetical protein